MHFVWKACSSCFVLQNRRRFYLKLLHFRSRLGNQELHGCIYKQRLAVGHQQLDVIRNWVAVVWKFGFISTVNRSTEWILSIELYTEYTCKFIREYFYFVLMKIYYIWQYSVRLWCIKKFKQCSDRDASVLCTNDAFCNNSVALAAAGFPDEVLCYHMLSEFNLFKGSCTLVVSVVHPECQSLSRMSCQMCSAVCGCKGC